MGYWYKEGWVGKKGWHGSGRIGGLVEGRLGKGEGASVGVTGKERWG